MAQERFKIIPSVYLVLIKDGKILLSRRFNTGYFDSYYSLPAGHLDENETFTQGTIREAKEEIGISLNAEDLKLVHVMDRMIPGDERADFFFTAKKWQGEPKNMEPDKCDGLDWFELNNLPQNVVPYVRQAIDCILNNIIFSEREGREK
ncbi:MAG: NUDIX domain-containing protein [Candidatus Wildermuthbacteria bacterium]|nr:NUDIX domain-containing protein [Candidatus Wildermuthbacteria bacterium]